MLVDALSRPPNAKVILRSYDPEIVDICATSIPNHQELLDKQKHDIFYGPV